MKKIIVIYILTLLITTSFSMAGNIKNEIIPNDPEFNEQWSLHNIGQTGGKDDADIDAPEAWEIEKGNSDIVIAIIDSGIDETHPDLINNIWINEDEIPDNGIDDDNNGYIDDYQGFNFFEGNNDIHDNYGHGTRAAGIIGAETNNSIGIAGILWNCKIMIVKVWDQDFITTVDIILEGIRYAANNGAKIISMSLGTYENQLTENELRNIRQTANYTYEKGCISIASAGNDGRDDPFYPAALDKVIAVAGTDHRDKQMKDGMLFASNHGEWVDVAAPGELVYTTVPTYPNNYGVTDYSLASGTSYATPHVSSIAALLLSKNPDLTPEEVMKIIRSNNDPYDSELYLGTGRVNAYKALMEFNHQPETPDTPTGNTNGRPGREYTFTTSTTDSDGDELWYFWDWGDGNYSDWLGSYASGDTCEVSYTWQQEANFSIRVKVKDGEGGESYWSDVFIFSTPKSKSIIPFGTIIVFGFDVDVKIVQLEPDEDYVDLEVLSKPFYIWENGIETRNPGEFIRLYTAKGLFSPSLPFCFGTCNDWGIIG
jgi:hypothetical protein